MKLPVLVALRALQSSKGVVTFTFESGDGRAHHVPMKAGVINAMLAPLLSVAAGLLGPTDKEAQLLTLTRYRTMLDEHGRAILEVHLDGAPLRIVLPPGMSADLAGALSELGALAAQSGSQSRH